MRVYFLSLEKAVFNKEDHMQVLVLLQHNEKQYDRLGGGTLKW